MNESQSVEVKERTPSLKVLQKIELVKKKILEVRDIIVDAYALLEHDGWTIKEIDAYMIRELGISTRTLRRYKPPELKDMSKVREPVGAFYEEAKSETEFAANLSAKPDDQGWKDADEITNVETTDRAYTATFYEENPKFDLKVFKQNADDVNIFYIEDREIWQIQREFDSMKYGDGKFNCIIQRITK